MWVLRLHEAKAPMFSTATPMAEQRHSPTIPEGIYHAPLYVKFFAKLS
jgi:hypothetical protein